MPCEVVDDEPEAEGQHLTGDQPEEKPLSTGVEVDAAAPEDDDLDKPGDEHAGNDVGHQVHGRDREADRVEGPPGQAVAGPVQQGHDAAAAE